MGLFSDCLTWDAKYILVCLQLPAGGRSRTSSTTRTQSVNPSLTAGLSTAGTVFSILVCSIIFIICACRMRHASHESRVSRSQGALAPGTLQNSYCQGSLAEPAPRNTGEDTNSPTQQPVPPYTCPYYAVQDTQGEFNAEVSEDNPPAYHMVVPSNSESVTPQVEIQHTHPNDVVIPLPISDNIDCTPATDYCT